MTDEAIAAERKAGLMAGGVAIPLEGVSVDAQVTAFCARVTISQRYHNLEAQPVEAVYVFPLDEGAAVCGFEAVVNGVHYVGRALEREEAFKRYDEAMEQGHGAYLLDEERPDVFTASLGNVPPGGEVLLRLTYVSEVPLDGDALRFTVPTTVSPRYAPAEDRAGVGRPDAEALNPPVAWSVPYGLDLSVALDLPAPITRVESPSHPVRVALDGSRATVTLAQEHAALDRDFVLLVAPSGAEAPTVILERDEEGREAALLAFRPVFETEEVPSEIVFVVDRSGSMGGSSIDQVRNALQLALRSLVPGCRFNIVGFGSTFTALFPTSRDYDEGSLKAAADHVVSLDADLGGTEILPALQFVLGQRRVGELPRQVVVLTDGEVTNTDAVLALARAHAADARVFTFGIGCGASHHLIRGLARAGGGTAEFIYPGERIEPKVMRQIGRLLSPALTDVKVDWGGLKVQQAPRQTPPVFAGSPVLVYAFVDQVTPARATLSARTPGGTISHAIQIDPAASRPGRTVGVLAARALIRELEESPEWTAARGSRQGRRKATQATAEIIRLATTYGLASRETSFVAIEHRRVPVEGDIVLRRVPVALTSGWGGLVWMMQPRMYGAPLPQAAQGWRSRVAGLPSTATAAFTLGASDGPEVDDETRASCDTEAMMQQSTLGWAPVRDAGARERAAPPARRPLDAIVALQSADGSWDLSRHLAEMVGRSIDVIEAHLGPGASDDLTRRAWATALALAWLEREAADRRVEWRLLARKAERWLARHAPRQRDGADWRDAARAFLAS